MRGRRSLLWSGLRLFSSYALQEIESAKKQAAGVIVKNPHQHSPSSKERV
ncbi:hypothetical protein JG688_00012255 [Phytophthora aleatoria]|uniref:Uncharacterized protein n=1 Tax=Phytophthora aleatoria TaxID=2496075 RepID=A0A8J5MET3_9STRA|nr:hypothetical protein JG688_00012255 [Phytophthora aleatoria]